MLLFFVELILLLALLAALAYYVFLLPPRYPVNIPAVPFWVALLPLFKDVDQSDIFAKYIEGPIREHGAVKLYFAGRWNVLLHNPGYLLQMFKEEDVYRKSGNQKKIPYSVMADFLGDNIISSHGARWKKYRAVIQPGLQRNFELATLRRNALRLCHLLGEAQGRAGAGSSSAVAVNDLLQRYTVANMADLLLQTDMHSLDSATAPINHFHNTVKQAIFQPVFMNFPILDKLPFRSRVRARKLVQQFKKQLQSALVASHADEPATEGKTDKLGSRLLHATETHGWDEKQVLDNVLITFVAGQENPQVGLTSAMYLLAKHPDVQERLHQELSSAAATAAWESDDAQQYAASMPYLTSVLLEILRLLPPLGQIVNRRAHMDTLLGDDILIPAGTYLGYNCYSTNRDPGAWGPAADCFWPERWGTSPDQIHAQYRERKLRAEFITFHGGRRACLGEKFALLSMRISIVALIRSFRWTLDLTWSDRKTPAGPLYPRALRLKLAQREKASAYEGEG